MHKLPNWNIWKESESWLQSAKIFGESQKIEFGPPMHSACRSLMKFLSSFHFTELSCIHFNETRVASAIRVTAENTRCQKISLSLAKCVYAKFLEKCPFMSSFRINTFICWEAGHKVHVINPKQQMVRPGHHS